MSELINQNRYICIHGHYYQPPRENAWLEYVEVQESAHPFHDWNERITAECYEPNVSSRILGGDDNIIEIVNNYSNISFNIGPSLLYWLEKNSKDVYNGILKADKLSQLNFGGHGSALAQVYNHIIMPLASKRDKVTQVIWGIKDFESRFKRKPEGMWLAETAVDTETLEVLAEQGILFTILSPYQAKSFKKLGAKKWTASKDASIDTSRPYKCNLPSGKSISLYFYDAKASQAVAFDGLLFNGKKFGDTLCQGFDDKNKNPQLVHIATDGESYGHHHRHGDMALAYALDYIEYNNYANLTNYGEFLELFPPEYEAQIVENSSWSCYHGVERWRADCGCNSGGKGDWNQKWRKPLREAFDWLNEEVSKNYIKEISRFIDVEDAWDLRNDFIDVILDRSIENADSLILKYVGNTLEGKERTTFIRLLEASRQCLLMYTSCGWFFDEISGIETVQILQYANRAIQLVEIETETKLTDQFLALLKKAPSNMPEYETGKEVYLQLVEPKRLTLSSVGMHYAVASLFEEYPNELDIYNYRAKSKMFDRLEAGNMKLAVGFTEVVSKVTYSNKQFAFAVVYLGQNHIIGNFSEEMTEVEFLKMQHELTNAFSKSQLAELIGKMQEYFGEEKFTLRNLFKDNRKKVLDKIVEKGIDSAEAAYREIFNDNYNLMNMLREDKLPIPQLLKNNFKMVVNNEIIGFFETVNSNPLRLEKLTRDAIKWEVELNKEDIEFVAEPQILELMKMVKDDPSENLYLNNMNRIFKQLEELKIQPDWWKVQNEYFNLSKELLSDKEMAAEVGNKEDLEWLSEFKRVGEHIKVQL